MTSEQLDRSRKIVPGVVVIACWTGAGYYLAGFRDLNLLTGGIAAVAAMFLGWIYDSTNVRYVVTNAAFEKFNSHIVKRLYDLCGTAHPSNPTDTFWKLKPSYYDLIDNDESLKRLRDRIYGNGAIWTAWADVTLVTAFHSAIFGLVWIGLEVLDFELQRSGRLLVISILFLAVAAAFRFLLYPMAVQNHLPLMNEQIDHLGARHKTEICREIERLEAD